MVMKQVAQRVQLRFHHDRNPNLGSHPRLASLKHGRRYAHNGVTVLVDFNCLAHNVWIRTEMRLPEAVADDRHGRVTRLLVFRRQETAPKDRPHPEYLEIIRRHYHARDALWSSFARQAHLDESARRYARKALLPVADCLDIRIGKRE